MAWIVYELLNEARQELFVGLTERDVETEFDLNRAIPPDPIRHWDFGSERVRFQTHRRGLTRHEARETVREFAAPPGWVLRKQL